MSKKTYVCKECGSDQVFSDAFVSVNDPSDVRTFDAKHCETCEGECSIITKEDFDAQRPARNNRELLEWREQLVFELEGMGFDDPDQSIDGGDAVEYLGKLYQDLLQMTGKRT